MSSQPPTKDELQRQVDEVKQDADVQRALNQATPAKKTEAPVRGRDKFFIGTHLAMLIGLGVLYQVLKSQLWEFGGDYLSTEHPSGRIIKFPNSTVLSAPVYNYTWPSFRTSGTRSGFRLHTMPISNSSRRQ